MPDIASLEGDPTYDVTWPWSRGEALVPGLTCVFRVRNEARNLPWVRIGVVDEGSDSVEVQGKFAVTLAELREVYEGTLPALFG